MGPLFISLTSYATGGTARVNANNIAYYERLHMDTTAYTLITFVGPPENLIYARETPEQIDVKIERAMDALAWGRISAGAQQSTPVAEPTAGTSRPASPAKKPPEPEDLPF